MKITDVIKENVALEGEVVPLGKKHRGDLDSVNSCSKCGGKLEGGTYMGQKIKVCQPCKQVYLPPNSGIDQKGNKIKEQGVAEGSLEEEASKLLSAQDKDGIITIIVQAPDGTKRSASSSNPNAINKWLMKYGLRLPKNIADLFVGVTEGMAQDEAEETNGWRAELVNQINYNTFEVKMTNTRSKESANFIVRPVDMISIGPTLQIETMDVHDLQTGQTASWTSDDPQPDGGIVYAIAMMFWDNKELQKKLWTIVDTHNAKGQDKMPGLDQRRSIGQEVDADAYIDSQEKTQFAMDKMKKGMAEEFRPTAGQAMGIRSQIAQKMNPGSSKFIWKRPNQIMGSHTENELRALKFRYSAKYNSWGGTQQMWGQLEGNLKEFAPSGAGRGGGNYFQALASAWYGGAYNTGSLQRGIKSKEDVERLLQQGIVCPDGVTRKFGIDYNAEFDGVVISSEDYYEHSDHGKRPGTMIDVRTGKPWGPYDYMEFSDADLSESLTEFAPTKPPTAGAFGGNKDYGQPTSSRYLGNNKFVLGTSNNYVLTATVDKWGLEWDEDDNIWYLDSPGAVYIADATEGEIELPAPQEQRNQIHDLVSDYLNARNSAELQRVAAYYGHSNDGEMATSEGIRVPAQQILGTKNRAKSAYYPTNVKPKVPKLDTPLTDKELARLSQLAGIDTNK